MIRPYPHDGRQREDWEGLENIQKTFDFERPDREAQAALPPVTKDPDEWKGSNPLHLNRTTFKGKRFYAPGEKEKLSRQLGSRKKKADATQDDTHALITDLLRPSSPAEQATAVMKEMQNVEELRKTETLGSLYPRLTSIRTALHALGVLEPVDANMRQVAWNAPIDNEQSGVTYAERFAGTFHYYLEEILPMLAEGVAKSGEEAMRIHDHHVHESLSEAIRRLEARKKK